MELKTYKQIRIDEKTDKIISNRLVEEVIKTRKPQNKQNILRIIIEESLNK